MEPFARDGRYMKTSRRGAMINCLHFRARWRERDQLTSVDSMRIRRHLAVCQRCQAFDQQMRVERDSEASSAGEEK
jgi:hypothetical protein